MHIPVKRWFDVAQTDLAKQHKAACEKSVAEGRCVKVFEGAYYYKGFYIFRNNDKQLKWSWRDLRDVNTLRESTKRECIQMVECLLNHNQIYKELQI